MATSRISEVKAPPHNGTPAQHLLEAVDRVLHFLRRQLAVVRQVGHDGDVAAADLLDVAQQLNEAIGVGIGGETLRPKSQRARADSEILDVRQVVGVLERFQVLLEPALCDRDDAIDAVRNGSNLDQRPPTTSSPPDAIDATRKKTLSQCILVFMIIGSPPVNKISETSSCSSR